MELNEIIQQRKAKFEALEAKGVSVYGTAFSERINIIDALDSFQEGKSVALCGRIMAKRSHGKVVFLDLRDSTGKIQLYIKSDFVGEDKFEPLRRYGYCRYYKRKGRAF